MIIYDSDLKGLAKIIGEQLGLEIKLCTRFSRDGLLHIGKYAVNLVEFGGAPYIVEEFGGAPYIDEGLTDVGLGHIGKYSQFKIFVSWFLWSLDVLFRRPPRGGVEIHQFEQMKEKVEGCILTDMMDRWFWPLEGSGEFTITLVRKMIDDFMLPEVSSKTRWIKAVPIKNRLAIFSLHVKCLRKFCERFLDGGILIIWRSPLMKNG
nr:RNA-directed DNA polymerase, eukaryota [Tanacetum cinerariifolium]